MTSIEETEKFETELVWCLEQLHLSMQTRKLNEKQGKMTCDALSNIILLFCF